MNKRDRERAILRIVYNETEFDSILQQESPDFVLSRKGHVPFGVEVTEMFDTEADARALAHPKYISSLLSGAPPMHKDDSKLLPRTEVTIVDPDGKEKASGVPAIMKELPTVEERAESLSQVIEKKQQKHSSYAQGLSHVNLILMDRSDSSWRPSSLNVGDLLTAELSETLFTTNFREVYFVTTTRDRDRFYLPLRMLLLIAEIHFFAETVPSFADEDFSLDDIVPAFAALMADQNRPVKLVHIEGKGSAACLGNTAVRPTVETLEILDQADFPQPPTLESVAKPPSFLRDPEFLSQHARNVAEHTLITEIAMTPVVDPSF